MIGPGPRLRERQFGHTILEMYGVSGGGAGLYISVPSSASTPLRVQT